MRLRKNSVGGVAVLALALGIGSNTVLFSVANAVLLRPLPYSDPDRLMTVWETRPAQSADRVPASAPSFATWRDEARSFERLAAFRSWGFALTGSGEPERLIGARASADLFPLLGLTPVAGRTFSRAEDEFGGHHVAVVSDALWKRRFASDPALIGRSIVLNGESYEVIGVLPHDTTLVDAEVWVPLALEPFALQQRGTRALTVVGRLRRDATPAQAQAEIQTIAARLAKEFPAASAGWDIAVVPMLDHLVGSVRPTVVMVWAAVALVLLIACANTANLLLARAAARRQEILVCLALGASRGRLLRRLLAESVLLGLLGGAAGIPIAFAGLRAFVALAPPGLPRLDSVGLDATVLVFTLATSVMTGVLFGIAPALRSIRPQLSSALKDAASSSLGGGTPALLRGAALAGQVGLAVVVLVAAGLLLRSFQMLTAVDSGFQADHVVTMTLSLPDAKYAESNRRVVFHEQLLQRVAGMPGVESVGLVSHLPLAGRRLTVDVVPDPQPASDAPMLAEHSSVSPGYFAAMRIRLQRGRVFGREDSGGAAPVVVINDQLARRLWPDGDPIGKRIIVGSTSGGDPRPREIVGVVSGVRATTLESLPALQVYVPASQNPWPTMSLVVRGSGEATQLAGAIRVELQALDPDQPVFNVRSLEAVTERALALRRFQMLVLALFAGVGLVLATIGVYSVVAYTVRLRTREIGLRLALGASPARVLLLAMRGGLVWAGVGLVAGGAAALLVSRLLRGLLFGVAPQDPATFAGVVGFTAAVTILSAAIAARRATRIDPLVALRHAS